MTNPNKRFSFWRLENTLAAGLFLIVLLGLLGNLQTMRAMKTTALHTRQIETHVDLCTSLAKQAILHSHDTSFYTLSYVYSGSTGDRDQKWEKQDALRAEFSNLRDQLKQLPESAALQAECAAAERQNREVCEPQELQEIALVDHGKARAAQKLLQTKGTAGRDNLEAQLNGLVGANLTQYPSAAPRGLDAYRIREANAEDHAQYHTILKGEVVQAAILLFSLLVAFIVIRTASVGIRTVLHAQEDLRESEACYRVLFDGNPQPMFVYDRDTLRFLAVNEAAVRNYGYSRDEFLGMTILDIRPEEDHGLLQDTLRQTLQIGQPLKDSIWRHRRQDGALFWVQITSHPLQWSHQAAAMVIAQDITARRAAEAGLNQLAALVQSSQDAIIGWNLDHTIANWNPGAERLYGWTAEEMIGQTNSVLVPPDREEEKYCIAECIRAGRPAELSDTVRLHKDGRTLEVAISISLIRNSAQEIIGTSTIARDISEQKKSEALIRWQAYNDPLTNLPNRAYFQQALEEAILRAAPFSVLFVDLDQFKHVNDSLGHAAGDQMLQEVTARFERCLERDDLLARMGGDEFTLLLLEEAAQPDEKAQALLHSLFQPLYIEGHELHVAASIGFSRFPDHAEDAETLLKCADLAMYHAKENGRGQWQEFSPSMTEAARERLTLENSLRKAIEREELLLLYQPQVSLETGEVIGSEALVRWQHPDFGLVLPARFIPLAEETGLIVPLGEWVLRTACRQAARWERAGTPLRQSVNLSARQLTEHGLVESVRCILDETGLSPHLLDLELTETTLVAQGEAVVDCLAALRALGVRISLDDFGTGYSSLAYLRRFPLDVLKVDRSFVRGLTEHNHTQSSKDARQDQAVVRAIIDMAHALDLEVVAEGVETTAQRETLRYLECDYMQGFLFSPPVTPEHLERMLPIRRLEQREAQAA